MTADNEEYGGWTRQRGRLFYLTVDSKWCEIGIGQVQMVEKSKEMFLLLSAESDDSRLLEVKIQPDTAYKKLEGRFLIWTENNTVLGLSFQENAGRDDVWEIICQVQGKDPSVSKDVIKKEEDMSAKPPERCVDPEAWLEEMLDIEHAQLSAYETDVLEQLIQLVNRLGVADSRRYYNNTSI